MSLAAARTLVAKERQNLIDANTVRDDPATLDEDTLQMLADEFDPALAGIDQAVAALTAAERFIVGFEGDSLQQGIDQLLAEIRAARGGLA